MAAVAMVHASPNLENSLFIMSDAQYAKIGSGKRKSVSNELIKCKRKINFQPGKKQQAPSSVSKRNARERNRVKMVNNGFATLRDHVPSGKKNKKLSKVETLRSAVEYIKQLKMVLEGEQQHSDCSFDSPIGSPSSEQQSASITSNHTSNELCYYMPEIMGGMPTIPAYNQQLPRPSSNSSLSPQPEYITLSNMSPSGSVASSPTPSYLSDTSSYENISPDDQDLLDFSTWFS